MKTIILIISSFLLFACANSKDENYYDAKGCYAYYAHNNTKQIVMIDKIQVKNGETKVFIRNNGTSSANLNHSLININKPIKIECKNSTKTEKLNSLF